MSGLAERWRLALLRQMLSAARADCAVECVERIDSTNSELMRRLRAGDPACIALVAEQQSAGRGRLGRSWQGSAATVPGRLPGALTFSLSVPLASPSWSGLSLALGLAVAQSLHGGIGLKWPNDLWWQNRKLAGILIETASLGERNHAVIGVGINIAPRSEEGLATAPACLREIAPELDAATALQRVLPAVLQALAQFEAAGLAPFLAGYRERDVLAGRGVLLSDGTTGQAAGVDGSGALLVHTALGMSTITSSEVSVRPLASARQPTDGPSVP